VGLAVVEHKAQDVLLVGQGVGRRRRAVAVVGVEPVAGQLPGLALGDQRLLAGVLAERPGVVVRVVAAVALAGRRRQEAADRRGARAVHRRDRRGVDLAGRLDLGGVGGLPLLLRAALGGGAGRGEALLLLLPLGVAAVALQQHAGRRRAVAVAAAFVAVGAGDQAAAAAAAVAAVAAIAAAAGCLQEGAAAAAGRGRDLNRGVKLPVGPGFVLGVDRWGCGGSGKPDAAGRL
jgi:hypothetical protein